MANEALLKGLVCGGKEVSAKQTNDDSRAEYQPIVPFQFLDGEYEDDNNNLYQDDFYNFNNNSSLFQYFPLMNDEIKMYILSFMTLKDLLSLSQSCKEMRAMVEDRLLWFQLLNSHGFSITDSIRDNSSLDLKKYFSDLKNLTAKNSVQWSPLEFNGVFPTKRYKHTSSVYKNYVVIIGGQRSNSKRYGDIYYYDTKTNEFSRPKIVGDQPPRFSRHTSQVIGDKIYIFGGFNGNGTYFNLSTYNLKLKKWKNILETKGMAPDPRSNHSSAVIGSKYYIFSGNNTTNDGEYKILEDFYYLETKTLTWHKINATGDIPCGRGGHTMEVIDGKIYLFGGGIWSPVSDWTQRFNDIHIYDPETNCWSKPSIYGPAPNTSTFTTSFVYGRFLVLFGGGCQSTNSVCNNTYALDTKSMNWINMPLSDTYTPRPRDMATASLVGNNLFVFGGFSGGPVNYFDQITFNFTPLLK
ncbi:hypothetical protein DFA_07236 [Cavenderia fasciculata]|uniref:F-box domain-containing protein n=1 Tax=Cavenderia fasciculata TaxID=261658 RepID=F4PVV2_CACFS|nr:uncharacterized protein DFA_07236 [Cavenderia fasciculata]EGG20116.1 hypothetical protein DFA_07236 [Cavenderia fasciculata]|eukprot:XP_004367099.1 hypothetical protein DFA_07236 [Cavenderia fasciculata]